MSQNNAQRQLPYDHPAVLARYASQLAANSAGSGNTSGKFYAHANLQVYGVTFQTVTAGTSTYTVAGTATAQAAQFSAIYITNTATGSVALATSTIGPFTIGGTTTTGANVSVGGIGGAAGGYQGPYALNTLGGTQTSLTWGTNTYIASPGTATGSQIQVGMPGAGNAGLSGLPMNPGDQLYFVNGTDATAVIVPTVQWGYAAGTGNIVA